MPMLVHVPVLSWWEIAHYWHGFDPRNSTTHDLPLIVRDTLLVISMEWGKALSLRVEPHRAYLLEILGQAPRFTARHYRHRITKAIDSKRFGRRFFENMFLTRSQLGRWCKTFNEPFPEFWFPDNEKYPFIEVGDISHEMTANGRYITRLIYNDRVTSPSAEASDLIQSETATVSENAIKAANAKHAPVNAIKKRFSDFYLQRSAEHKSKSEVARHFFDHSLSDKERYQFASRDTAVRTLLDSLRKDIGTE
jgi:hypothetical protein